MASSQDENEGAIIFEATHSFNLSMCTADPEGVEFRGTSTIRSGNDKPHCAFMKPEHLTQLDPGKAIIPKQKKDKSR